MPSIKLPHSMPPTSQNGCLVGAVIRYDSPSDHKLHKRRLSELIQPAWWNNIELFSSVWQKVTCCLALHSFTNRIFCLFWLLSRVQAHTDEQFSKRILFVRHNRTGHNMRRGLEVQDTEDSLRVRIDGCYWCVVGLLLYETKKRTSGFSLQKESKCRTTPVVHCILV